MSNRLKYRLIRGLATVASLDIAFVVLYFQNRLSDLMLQIYKNILIYINSAVLVAIAICIISVIYEKRH